MFNKAELHGVFYCQRKASGGSAGPPRTPGKQLRCPCPNVIPLALNDAPRQWTRFLAGTAIRGSRLRWEWLAPHLTWGHGCASDGGCSSEFPCGGLSRTRSTQGVQAARAPQASLFCLCQRLLKVAFYSHHAVLNPHAHFFFYGSLWVVTSRHSTSAGALGHGSAH